MQYCILTLRKDSKLEDYFSAVQFSKYSIVCVFNHPLPTQSPASEKIHERPSNIPALFPELCPAFFIVVSSAHFQLVVNISSIPVNTGQYMQGTAPTRRADMPSGYIDTRCVKGHASIYTYMHHKNKNIKLVCQIEFPFTIIIHSLKIGTKMKKTH